MLTTILIAVAAFLLAMIPLVVVHEWGHFWVARKLGVKILRFSVGFGKPLLVRRYGPDQTEWVISAIPFGGYVKMVDEAEGTVAPEDLPRAFNRQPLWKRSLIVLAGPMANLLFAFVVYTSLLMFGVLQLKPEVVAVTPGSVAESVGFVAGDRVLAVNDRKVSSWADVDMFLLLEALGQRKAELHVQTVDGRKLAHVIDFSSHDRRTLGPRLTRSLGFSILPQSSEARIGAPVPGGAGEKAGVMPGDRVLTINGTPVSSWDAMAALISASPAQPLTLDIERGTRRVTVKATPDAVMVDGKRQGRLGISASFDEKRYNAMLFTQRMGLGDAMAHAWQQGSAMTRLTLEMMGRMALLQVSTENLSGPVGIANMAGETLMAGPPIFITFLVIMSLSLGLLNLLPIPMLDGGHLVYYLAEAIRGRPLSDRTLSIALRLGVVLLGLLTLLAFYNDLHRLLPSH